MPTSTASLLEQRPPWRFEREASTSATKTVGSSGRQAHCRAAELMPYAAGTIRLQRVRAYGARHPLGAHGFRGRDAPSSHDLKVRTSPADRRLSARICGVVWVTCGPNQPCTWSPKWTPTAARASRGNPHNTSSPVVSRFSTWMTPSNRQLRPNRVLGRNGTLLVLADCRFLGKWRRADLRAQFHSSLPT